MSVSLFTVLLEIINLGIGGEKFQIPKDHDDVPK